MYSCSDSDRSIRCSDPAYTGIRYPVSVICIHVLGWIMSVRLVTCRQLVPWMPDVEYFIIVFFFVFYNSGDVEVVYEFRLYVAT